MYDSETTNTAAWREPAWTIYPHNFPGVLMPVAPPAPLQDLQTPRVTGWQPGTLELEKPVLELTREEISARIERGAMRRRGLSARALIKAYREGRLDNPGEVADLLALSNLLPKDDPLFGNTA